MTLTNEDLQAIATLFLPMENRMDRIEGRLDRMEGRMDKMESEISALKAGQSEIRKDIRELDKKISDTYEIALNAWGTSAENRNWLSQIG